MIPKAYAYIRYSSNPQEMGISVERQKSKILEYVENNKDKFSFDEADFIIDKGKSGYTGEHLKTGELGKFINKVENGLIKRGSYLLLESIDRLSREGFHNAVGLQFTLVKNDINFITINDGIIYSKTDEDPLNAMIGVFQVFNAHQESDRKSRHSNSNWVKKFDNAQNQKIVCRLPAWLEWKNESKKEIVIIEERKAIINQIFNMRLKGIGTDRIARILNSEKVPNWGKGKQKGVGWHGSYVKKLLNNRAVIGEFQPFKKIEGIKEPYGEPLIDYFPKVVDENTFYKVSELLKNNRIKGGNNKAISNLFTGIAKCGYCRAPMHFENKGKYRYLVCDNAKRKTKCKRYSFPYDEFEESFLLYLKELNPDSILNNPKELEETILSIEGEIHRHEHEYDRNNKRIENLYVTIENTEIENLEEKKQFVNETSKRINDIVSKNNDLKLDIEQLKGELDKTKKVKYETLSSINDIKTMIDKINNSEPEKKYSYRLRLRNFFHELIELILVYPIGNGNESKLIDELVNNSTQFYGENDSQPMTKDKFLKKFNKKHFRYYTIKLKNGVERTISNSYHNELYHDIDIKDGNLILPHITDGMINTTYEMDFGDEK